MTLVEKVSDRLQRKVVQIVVIFRKQRDDNGGICEKKEKEKKPKEKQTVQDMRNNKIRKIGCQKCQCSAFRRSLLEGCFTWPLLV